MTVSDTRPWQPEVMITPRIPIPETEVQHAARRLVTPFKRAIGPAYVELEARLARTIHLAFGLPALLPQEWREVIDRADRLAAFIEAIHLAGFTEAEARQVFGFRRPAPDVDIDPWDAPTARKRFLTMFQDLAAGGMSCRRQWRIARNSQALA